MSDLVSQNLNMIFKTPKGETVHALKDVNFTLKKGELLTVLGPSGCGKTTLLNITAGFIRPTSGKITLNNNEIDDITEKYYYLHHFFAAFETAIRRKLECPGRFGGIFRSDLRNQYVRARPGGRVSVPANLPALRRHCL